MNKQKLKLIHGAGEIPRISSQVKEAFKIIDGQDIRLFKNDPKRRNKILDLGFHSNCSSGITFIGKTQVIKCGLLVRRPPPIRYRIPTLIYNYTPIRPCDWDWNYVVIIQPKVVIPHYIDLDSKYFKPFFKLSRVDLHDENVGIHNGKMLLIDW